MKQGLTSTLFVIILAGIFLISCDNNRVYEENVNLDDHRWNRSNTLIFNVEITDTVSPHNIYVNVRNGGQYSYSNLYMFIRTVSPSGQWIRDTVEFTLADEKGKWFGNGLGDIFFLQLPYKENVRFPYPGLYSFELEQAMRSEELKQIFDIGIRIEKIE
jgi:gliding motility-associated lipoprotein GldH